MKTHQFKSIEELDAAGGPKEGDRLMPFGWEGKEWEENNDICAFRYGDDAGQYLCPDDVEAMIRDSKGTVYIERDVEEPRVLDCIATFRGTDAYLHVATPLTFPKGDYRVLVFPAGSPGPYPEEMGNFLRSIVGKDYGPRATALLEKYRGMEYKS